jgi:prophage tail gpP-like protein
MADNKVKLKINNQLFEGWEDVEISSELDTIARSFQVGITLNTPSGGYSLTDFLVGTPIQIFIGSDLVLTGYIEQTPVSYDANQKTITIAGRSKTGDLIDCCAFPSNQPIIQNDKKEWSYKAPVTGTVVAPANQTARSWQSEKIEKIIATLVAPYDIKLISEVNLEDKKNNFAITPTDKVLDSLRNLTKNSDLTFCDNENGDLVLVKKATTEADKQTTCIELGKTILSGQATFDGTKLYTDYAVIGQDKGTDNAHGKSIDKSAAVAKGIIDLHRTRYIYTKAKGQATSANCQKEATGNQKYADNQFYKATYVVQGWRYDDTHLWKVNQLVQIKDEFLQKDGSDWYLIERVTFSLSNSGGMTTTLDVVPPDGYKLDNESAEKNATSKKKTSVNTSSGMKVEKNKYKTKYWS